jgi:alpha-galactosidase/6-phospho-beta-glucosidase family protein
MRSPKITYIGAGSSVFAARLVSHLLRKRCWSATARRRALMLDPLTAAVCSLEEINRLFDEMWAAQRAHLNAFV